MIFFTVHNTSTTSSPPVTMGLYNNHTSPGKSYVHNGVSPSQTVSCLSDHWSFTTIDDRKPQARAFSPESYWLSKVSARPVREVKRWSVVVSVATSCSELDSCSVVTTAFLWQQTHCFICSFFQVLTRLMCLLRLLCLLWLLWLLWLLLLFIVRSEEVVMYQQVSPFFP